ncbi:MAG: ABC transporter permease, partial [Chloroflexota bacterium]|nr:ABC transporter permease [Chloroflexota bacterium]
MSLGLASWAVPRPQRRLAGIRPSSPDYLFSAGLWLLGGLLVAFVGLPILRIYVGLNLSQLFQVAFGEGVLPSIGLSIEAALLSAALATLLGVPLAYRLSRDSFPAKGLMEMVVDLPLAVPHSVAGIALLFVFGRQGILGRPLGAVGLQFWGSLAGIVVGMLFVSCPFMVNTARVAFDGVDLELEQIAQTEGASSAKIFWMVAVPLASRGIFTGGVLSYARALSEFGAVVILAYYPMTAPIKIYDLFLQGGLGPSTMGAALLLAAALGSFLVL